MALNAINKATNNERKSDSEIARELKTERFQIFWKNGSKIYFKNGTNPLLEASI